MRHLRHLVRRAVTSLSNRPLNPDETAAAARCLLPAELELWQSMQPRDRRHSLEVLRRFLDSRPSSSRAECAAALLHDVGKTASNLGWGMRVVATVIGPRGNRFTAYHDHERLGAEMLADISDPRTVELVAGTLEDDVRTALCEADDV